MPVDGHVTEQVQECKQKEEVDVQGIPVVGGPVQRPYATSVSAR